MGVLLLGVVAVAFHMTLSNSIGGETFTNTQQRIKNNICICKISVELF